MQQGQSLVVQRRNIQPLKNATAKLSRYKAVVMGQTLARNANHLGMANQLMATKLATHQNTQNRTSWATHTRTFAHSSGGNPATLG